jgi:hypothetical protein
VLFTEGKPEPHIGETIGSEATGYFFKKKGLSAAKYPIEILFFPQTKAFFQHILGNSQFFAARGPAVCYHFFTSFSAHALQKSMTASAFAGFRLISSLRHMGIMMRLCVSERMFFHSTKK